MIRWNWTPDPRRLVFIDFETQSTVDLRERGVWPYVRNSSTRLLSAVWKLPGKKPRVWAPRPCPGLSMPGLLIGEKVPAELAALARTHTFVAHNAEGFDALLWEALYPGTPITWLDTLPLCKACGLPGSIDALGEMLGYGGKNAEGKDALMLLSRVKSTNRPPVGTVPLWQKMLAYNVKDVEVLEAVYCRVSPALEHHAERLTIHSKINERGIQVDKTLALKLSDLWERAKSNAGDKVYELTDGKLSSTMLRSVPAVHNWLRSQGLYLDTLRREEVDSILADPSELGDIDDEKLELVTAVLRQRSIATRTADAKISRLIDAIDRDNVLRYLFVYHGAATGRWSSRGYQAHNLPKGDSEFDTESFIASACEWSDLKKALTATNKRLKAKGRPATELVVLLNTLQRPIFQASRKKRLGIIDFGAIEARCLAWMSREAKLLELFGDPKKDVYLDMASALFGRPLTKDDKVERQVGKIIILGCLAAGTPVLTNNGWKPIEKVLLTDEVWDGYTWVSHGGVIEKGEKPVVNVNGVWMTEDHKVLTDKGWVEAWQAREGIHVLPLGDVLENGRLSLSGRYAASADVPVVRSTRSSSVTCSEDCRHDVTSVQSEKRLALKKRILDTLMCVRAPYCGNVYSTVFPLSCLGVSTLITESTDTTGGEVLQSLASGGLSGSTFYDTCSHSQDMTTHRLRLIESTTMEIIDREISGSQREPSKYKTVATTYDILNAGPRNRFQAGLLIVHNCGYSMGPVRFEAFCRLSGIDLAAVDLTGKACVEGYRKQYPLIPKLWKAVEQAAMKACRGTPSTAGRCHFTREGDDLRVELPSGRPIYYRNARICKQVPAWARMTRREVPPQDAIVYDHPHGYVKTLYGGLITENLDQAISNDVLAESMKRLDASGFDIRLHVHDEAVFETSDDKSIGRAAEIMSTPPAWAKDFPITVEGFTCPRYSKSPYKRSRHVRACNGKTY